MKVIEETSRVAEQVGDMIVHDFKIKANAKSFNILSKGIYTNDISPPIRELATNAYDSHVEAGNPEVPFEVHLPTLLEPWFSVRDFGVGMNEEEINRIYTTYFESTKTESNDFTGCLGLGSKSPFCYTDTFSVESIQDGLKLIYTCFLENGTPKCAKLGEEKTTDGNGMHIEFAVKEGDVNTFLKYAESVYNRFIHRPKILNCPEFNYIDREADYSGTDWQINKSDKNSSNWSHGSTQSVIIMGNIAYPIDVQNLKIDRYGHNDNPTDDTTIRSLLDTGIEVTFGIGQLEISANRESLHFDDRTIRNIKSKLIVVGKELVKIVSDKLEACDTVWDANSLYNDVFLDHNSLFSSQVVRYLNKKDFSWNGEKLTGKFKLSHMTDPKLQSDIAQYSWSALNGWRSDCKVRLTRSDVVIPRTNTRFAFNDLKTGGVSRMRFYVESHHEQSLYVVDSLEILADILTTFGISEDRIMKTSDMEKSPVVRRKSSTDTRKLKKLLSFSTWNITGNWGYAEPVEILNDTKYYLLTFDGNLESINWYDAKEFVGFAKDIGVIGKDSPIYGIPSGQSSRIKKLDNWINVYDAVKEYADTKTDEISASQTYWDSRELDGNASKDRLISNLGNICKQTNVDSPLIMDVYNALQTMKSNIKKDHKQINIHNKLTALFKSRFDDVKLKSTVNLSETLTEIYETYPLLQYIEFPSTLNTEIINETSRYLKTSK